MKTLKSFFNISGYSAARGGSGDLFAKCDGTTGFTANADQSNAAAIQVSKSKNFYASVIYKCLL